METSAIETETLVAAAGSCRCFGVLAMSETTVMVFCEGSSVVGRDQMEIVLVAEEADKPAKDPERICRCD